jgi:predicted phosphodiesterase
MKLFLILACCFLTACVPMQQRSAILVRGPYLQMVGDNTATLRWRTHRATDSKLEVGEMHGNYVMANVNPVITKEHEVTITGLKPGTKYYYRFGSSQTTIQQGQRNFFYTAPVAGSGKKIRIAVFGDCGRNYFDYQLSTLRAYRKYTHASPAQLLLLLGDNAYYEGTDRQYQRRFFNIYGRTILKHHALFPVPGNHDYYAGTPMSRDLAYYKNFTLPQKGELGGVPSGTEAYYSYNWGNIHFINLDSHGTEDGGTTRLFDTTGTQVQWLKKDLEANRQQWTIVSFHHPPYSKGSHDADTESDLINLRTHLNPILERYGVDLVMSGHSHNYERSYPLHNYYGKEKDFVPTIHTASLLSGRYGVEANTCPYTMTGRPGSGTIYVVSGSSGAGGDKEKSYPHDAMPFSVHDGGMFYIEVEGNRLDAKFIRRNGKVADQFTLMKGVNKVHHVILQQGFPAQLKASWIGNYHWATTDTTRSIQLIPQRDTSVIVRDPYGCLSDTFHIKVHPAPLHRTK